MNCIFWHLFFVAFMQKVFLDTRTRNESKLIVILFAGHHVYSSLFANRSSYHAIHDVAYLRG